MEKAGKQVNAVSPSFFKMMIENLRITEEGKLAGYKDEKEATRQIAEDDDQGASR